ncbi:hypothetical protein MKX01_039279 [Papaver californicum]|nr:hypothetical protein MKX01_039279 [Papaver californicum]
MFVIGVIILVISASTANARILTMPSEDVAASSSDAQVIVSYREDVPTTRAGCKGANNGTINTNDGVCTFCEQFTSQALHYVTQNKTKSEIIQSLEQACSLLQYSSFMEQQCLTLVDQHVSLFFHEIPTIKPLEFCKTLNLCPSEFEAATGSTDCHNLADSRHSPNNTTVDDNNSQAKSSQDYCTLCHCALATVLAKLKDPISQQQILNAIVLKGCGLIKKYVGGCDELVMKYGPLILENLASLLETFTCNSVIHVC